MAAGLAREQLVTHTVPAPLEKCTTARHPRCTAAARAVATAVPTKTRVERTLVESSARRILGNPRSEERRVGKECRSGRSPYRRERDIRLGVESDPQLRYVLRAQGTRRA